MNKKTISLTKPKVEAIRKQAHANMRVILKKLGFRGQDYGDRITGCCPIPHRDSHSPNDNPQAFSWDYSRNMWQCFSHRCHQINGADVFAMVQSAKKIGFRDAVIWVAEALNANVDNIQGLSKEETQKLEDMIRKRTQLVRHKQLEDDTMQHLKPSDYFLKRGFSEEVIREFKCHGEWHKRGTYGEGRAIVPIYDPTDGYLIAFTCRLINDDEQQTWRPKWLHCLNFAEMRKKAADRTEEEKFHASSVLFNLHRARQHMGESKSIILVEGPGDVMRLWEAGFKNAVACLGTGFGKNHRSLLLKAGCQRVISVLDGDAAGQKAGEATKKLCSGFFDFREVTMPEGTDPGDHDPAQLRMLFRDYL
jgi:DNA primase